MNTKTETNTEPPQIGAEPVSVLALNGIYYKWSFPTQNQFALICSNLFDSLKLILLVLPILLFFTFEMAAASWC